MVKHDIILKIRYYFVLGQSQENMSGVQKAWLLKFVYEFTNCDTAVEGIKYKIVTLVDVKLGLKKVTERVFSNIFNFYGVKLFIEELIHLHKDEYAEYDKRHRIGKNVRYQRTVTSVQAL